MSIDRDFGNWLAGFIDGEGCFSILNSSYQRAWSCRFAIKLRLDDEPILRECQQRLGIGTIQYEGEDDHGGKPKARWSVHTKGDALKLIEVLDEHPLRAKKARDYVIWREAVVEWHRIGGPRSGNHGMADWSRIEALKARLEAVRRYPVLAETPLPPAPEPEAALF